MLAGQDAVVVTEDGDGAPKQHTHSYCCLDYPSFVDVVQARHPPEPAAGWAMHADHMLDGFTCITWRSLSSCVQFCCVSCVFIIRSCTLALTLLLLQSGQ